MRARKHKQTRPHTHSPTRARKHTRTRARARDTRTLFECARACVWVCVPAGRESVCLRVCECRRFSESVRVRVRAGLCVRPHACAGVRQRPCGRVVSMQVCARICVRVHVRARARMRMRMAGCSLYSSAGGAGRTRGCGSVRSALGVARVRRQVRRGRAAPSRRNGLGDITTSP